MLAGGSRGGGGVCDRKFRGSSFHLVSTGNRQYYGLGCYDLWWEEKISAAAFLEGFGSRREVWADWQHDVKNGSTWHSRGFLISLKK